MSWKEYKIPDIGLDYAYRAEESSKYVISTPYKIACEMVELLPEELFVPETKFLNIFSKSGQILCALRNRLMESDALIKRFPNWRHRLIHINRHQLYGLCITEECADSTAFMLYNTAWNNYNNLVICNNILSLVKEDKNKALEFIHKNFKEYNDMLGESEETGEIMKFDVVIGNPPYNNDIYIPFVELGHHLADKCSVFITPAKWQAKGGKLNDQFRKNIVPHMSKIVYYPDCLDVFGISELGGISYYIIDKNVYDEKTIVNHSELQPLINSSIKRKFSDIDTLWNKGQTIVDKIRSTTDKFYLLNNIGENNLKFCTININKQSPTELSHVWDWDRSCIKPECIGHGGCIFDKNGSTALFGRVKYLRSNECGSGTSINLFTSDSKDECESFMSWIYSKFVRFLVIIGLCGTAIMNDKTWRFVPDPGAFDHIFTDEELYKKYNLTEEEINLIESVIKERK